MQVNDLQKDSITISCNNFAKKIIDVLQSAKTPAEVERNLNDLTASANYWLYALRREAVEAQMLENKDKI